MCVCVCVCFFFRERESKGSSSFFILHILHTEIRDTQIAGIIFVNYSCYDDNDDEDFCHYYFQMISIIIWALGNIWKLFSEAQKGIFKKSWNAKEVQEVWKCHIIIFLKGEYFGF